MARLTPMPMKAPWGSLLSRTVVGESYSCGEGSDGGANCWGTTASVSFADGTKTSRAAPVAAHAPWGVAYSGIMVGNDRTCAEGSDDRICCQGTT